MAALSRAFRRAYRWRLSTFARLIAPAALVLGLAGAPPAGPSAAAVDPQLGAGTALMKVDFGGHKRAYVAYLPKSYDASVATPLVVVLHGTGGSAKGMLWVGKFKERAESAGYIVVAPRSLGRAFNENSGRGGPRARGIDDVGFVEAVIHDIERRANVDHNRVFLAGFASGASMAQRIALESDSEIAAVAAVSGHLWIADRRPAKARSILLLWGADDPLNPVAGGKVIYPLANVMLDKPAPEAAAEKWARRLDCPRQPGKSTRQDGVLSVVWNACRDGVSVEFYSVDGLGHHWPGGERLPYPERIVGKYTSRIDATGLIWDFFRRQAR